MAKSKKPKLPRVWVLLDDAGYPHNRRPLIKKSKLSFPLGWTERQYAPVQKPKVCVWKPEEEMDWWLDKPRIYCQFCGGKIKVKS